jgi:hypothetical protein
MVSDELECFSGKNSFGIGLHTGKKGFDYYREIIEGLNDRFPADSLNVAERYMKGNMEIVARCNFLDAPTDYQLVFRRVPIGASERHCPGDVKGADFDVIDGRAEADERLVFVGIGEFVKRPESIIPSFVRFEEAHYASNSRVDFRGDFRDGFFKVRFRVSEDETEFLQREIRSQHGDGCADTLVEGGAKIIERIRCNGPQLSGRPGGELTLQTYCPVS